MTRNALDVISLVLRLIVAGVFLFAGWQKLKAPQEFADSIAAYQLLPVQLINLVALTLPPLELIIGFLLLVGWWQRIAAFSAIILTGVFMVALASAISRGLKIDCGCFGAGASAKGDLWLALARDLVLGAALVFSYFCEIGTAGKGKGVSLAHEAVQPESGDAEA